MVAKAAGSYALQEFHDRVEEQLGAITTTVCVCGVVVLGGWRVVLVWGVEVKGMAEKGVTATGDGNKNEQQQQE